MSAGISHPPREDVSWNRYTVLSFPPFPVILLVRMWVEMKQAGFQEININVILLVRMWVEIYKLSAYAVIPQGHPPREDVSWNIASRIIEEAEKRSSSSWGCELKWSPVIPRDTSDKSSSSWRCELKYDCKRCHKSSYKLSCLWCLEYIGYSNKNCKVVYEVAI